MGGHYAGFLYRTPTITGSIVYGVRQSIEWMQATWNYIATAEILHQMRTAISMVNMSVKPFWWDALTLADHFVVLEL